jgi:hypothetical protein
LGKNGQRGAHECQGEFHRMVLSRKGDFFQGFVAPKTHFLGEKKC